MITIGTAGHIDHGKSLIVKRLTGTDPDRLPEEKARGMTIDLGFAFYQSSHGDTVAFVDVPGHERFVKNMIAGAGGIDVVMLVIAADDGWMPQSEEHFQVVRLLGVRRGLIVINKIDLVEPEWLELLEQEVRDKTTGSFLQDAPIFFVSAQTGEGFDKLAAYLDTLSHGISVRNDTGKPRLYIDRTFIRQGIGGVVTGTLRDGNLSVGQTVHVWPSNTQGKIRSLQSNNQDVASVHPGQRTAVSLTGIDKSQLPRGGVLVDGHDISFFTSQPLLALSVELLSNAPVSLTSRRHLLMIIGTTEVEGEIRMFRQKEIKPSQSGIFFFRPDNPVFCLVNDHFIIRLPTPMVTLGGGRVLDRLDRFPRSRDFASFDYLDHRLTESTDDLVLSELEKRIYVPRNELLLHAVIVPEEVTESANRLLKSGKLSMFEQLWCHTDKFKQAVDSFRDRISLHLESMPHLKGLPIEQLIYLSMWDRLTAETLIRYMVAEGILVKVGDVFNLVGRGMTLKGVVKEAHGKIMATLNEQQYTPPTLSQLSNQGKAYREAIKYIIESGQGYKCGTSFIFLTEVWAEIVVFIRQRLMESNQLAVPDLRERFGFTRKYAIPVLEETDRLKLTHRDGDIRVKGDCFDDTQFIV